MSTSYLSTKVLSNKKIGNGIYKLHVAASLEAKPGQFFMLSAWEEQALLPRPISIQDIDKEGIHFLYQTKGKGTKLLSRLLEGDEVRILGPLGNGFNTERFQGKVAVVAGGIGTAPMNYLVKNLNGCSVDLYYGFRDEAYGLDSIKPYVNAIFISTEDGSQGHKGFITDIFDPGKYDAVVCCGPQIMMSKLAVQCREASVPIYVSTEKFMACGLGACLVCTCSTIYGNRRACTDGPVFLGEDLILGA